MSRVLKLTGWMLTVGAVLVVGSLLLLQLDSMSSWVGRRIATSLSGEALTIQVDRVTGSWIRGLAFMNLRLSATSVGEDGGWDLEVDTLRVGYRLLPFLKKTVSLSSVEGANVRFGLRMKTDESAESGGESPKSAGEIGEDGWAVLADVVRLRNGWIEVWEGGVEGEETPWALSEVSATVRDLQTRPDLIFNLDTIQGRFRPSGREDPWGHLLAAGQWGSDGIILDTLLLESPESQLSAGGILPLTLQNPWQEEWGLHLQADPVHLADLGPMLPPALADSLRVRARARVGYANGVLTAELRADAGTGGRAEASGRTEIGSGGKATSANVRVQGVDLRSWGFSESPLGIDLTVSATADSLRGSWEGAWSTRAEGLVAEGGGSFIPGSWPGWTVEGTASYGPTLNSPGSSSAGAGSTAPGGASSPAWLGSSTFTGGFRWAGKGFSLDSLSARGEVSVVSGNAGRVSLTGTRIAGQVEARGGTVGFQSSITSADTGRIRVAGVWERGGEGNRVRVDSLRFARVNLRSFLQPGDSSSTPETLLNGSLRGWARRAPGGWTGQGTLLLDSTRIGSQEVSRGRILAQGGSGGANVELELSLGPGEVQGQMTVAGSGAVPELTVHQMTFRNLDLGALVGEAEKATQLTGSLEGSTAGIGLMEAVARLRVELDSSMVGGVAVASADLEARSDSGRVNARLRAAAMGSTFDMEGNGSFLGAAPTFAAQGTFSHLRPAVDQEVEEPRGALHARFGLSGEGASLDSLQGSLWMEVDSARWEEVVLEEGRLEMRAAGGVLHLDTLSLESQVVSLVGGGMLPVSPSRGAGGEVRLDGRVHQAELLAGWLGAENMAVAEASFSTEAAGTLEDMNVTGEAYVAGLLMDELQLQELEISAQGQRRGGEGFTRGSATLRIDHLQRGPFPLRSLEAQASLENGNEVEVSGSAFIDDSRDGTFAFRLEDLPDTPLVKIERFEFRADPDRWVLQSPAGIHFHEGLEVDSLTLRSGSQEIQAQGRLARRGPLDLRLAVEDFRIGTLSDLMGFPSLQGRVTGSVAFAGDGESPRFTAGLQSRLEARNAPPSEVDLTASYAEQAMNLQADVGMEGERGLHATATLPFRLSLTDSATGFLEGEPLLMRLSADAFPLSWAGPFLSEEMIRDPRGTLNGSVTLTGVREEPALDGALAISDADARLPALGVRFERVHAKLSFQGETIFLDTLGIRTGEGSLSATGTIGIPGLESTDYDIRIMATDLHAIRSAGVDATVSGNIQVAGRSLEPAVTGNVVVRRADLYLDEMTSNSRVESVVLTEEDYQELARVFGYRERSRRRERTRILDGLSLDLDLDLRRASWLRQRSNPEMAVQFSGNLSVEKEPGDSVLLVGEVAAVPARSYVEQFGRRFSLTRGNLIFQGPPKATLIDLRAEHEVPSRDNPDQPEVVIALDISGTPEDLRLELSSSPPLEASDMVSYLAVGRPADRTLGGGEGSLSGAGEALALGRLSGAVEAYAREEVGLDVVEIITEGTEGVVLLAGRYVSPELYLGIRQPVSLHRTSGEASDRMSDPELEVELQAVRWLLLNLQAGGRSGVEFFVRSRISYE